MFIIMPLPAHNAKERVIRIPAIPPKKVIVSSRVIKEKNLSRNAFHSGKIATIPGNANDNVRLALTSSFSKILCKCSRFSRDIFLDIK